MKALLYKNFFTGAAGERKLSFIIFLIIAVVPAFAIAWQNIYFVMISVFMANALTIGSFSENERTRWDLYCDSLPIKRSTITAFHFLYLILMNLFVLVFSLISMWVISLFGRVIDIPQSLSVIALFCGVIMAMVGFLCIVFFRFGYQKAIILYLLLCGGLGGVVGVLSGYFEDEPNGYESLIHLLSYASPKYFVILAVSLCVTALSWGISTAVYSKKEL